MPGVLLLKNNPKLVSYIAKVTDIDDLIDSNKEYFLITLANDSATITLPPSDLMKKNLLNRLKAATRDYTTALKRQEEAKLNQISKIQKQLKEQGKQFRKELRKQTKKQRKKTSKEEGKLLKEERRELKRKWREKRYAKVKEDEYNGKFADLYHVPSWPSYGWFFDENHHASFILRYQTADRTYGSRGGNSNLSEHVFGASTIELKDILLTSKLIGEGLVAPPAGQPLENNFVDFLATTKLKLAASEEELETSLDLVRQFFGNDLAVGISLPLVYKRHSLDIDVKLPDGVFDNMTQTLRDEQTNQVIGTTFRQMYGGLFDEFLKDIFVRKGMNKHGSRNRFGFGDLTLFTFLNLHSRAWDRLIIGVRARIPTAAAPSHKVFWDPQLGNGGFAEISFYSGLLMSKDYKINPHIFWEATYRIPDRVRRRVPQIKEFNGQTRAGAGTSFESADGVTTAELLVLGEQVQFKNGTPFSQPDTVLKEFADQTRRLRIGGRFEAFLKVGNVFEKFIFRRGFLDVFYDLSLKDRDIVRNVDDIEWVKRVLEKDTVHIAHRLGCEYSYQFDAKSRARVGASYVFAGRNAPVLIQFNAALSVEF